MTCRLCASDNLKLFYKQGNKNQFEYYKCSNCGLVNLNLYNIYIDKHQEKYIEGLPVPTDLSKNIPALNTYSFIRKNIRNKGSYLDIGCGNGALLYLAKIDGWNVRGLELSQQLAESVFRYTNIEVDTANFMEFEDFNKQYDLVSLRHVLEHLPDPIKAMTNINKLLKTNAYAVLEFPNINGLSFKFKRLLSKLNIHNKKYSRDYVPGHCNEFNINAFKCLLKKTGFQLIKWETYTYNPCKNFIYNKIKIGTKMRVLIRKEDN